MMVCDSFIVRYVHSNRASLFHGNTRPSRFVLLYVARRHIIISFNIL
jgi:hypothetical protein